jgi:hypothetical protein
MSHFCRKQSIDSPLDSVNRMQVFTVLPLRFRTLQCTHFLYQKHKGHPAGHILILNSCALLLLAFDLKNQNEGGTHPSCVSL